MGECKILSMDLSLNLPCIVLLDITEDKKIKIIDTVYIDNKNKTKKTHSEKLAEIDGALFSFIKKHKLNNEDKLHIVRERGFSRFATETQALFKVVGIVDLLVLNELGVKSIDEITPPSVKKLVTGDGKASKMDVMDEVRTYLIKEQKNYKFYSDDVSDAVAVGIAHAIKKGLLV